MFREWSENGKHILLFLYGLGFVVTIVCLVLFFTGHFQLTRDDVLMSFVGPGWIISVLFAVHIPYLRAERHRGQQASK